MKQTTQTYLSLPETFHPASTASGKHPDSSMPRCYSDGRPYYSLNAWLKDQFGQKIYKLALDGGMTCPNRDGTLGTGGCIFCSHGGSGDFAEPAHTSVTEQIEAAKARVANKIKDGKYVAYFQSYTNTYAPVSYLEPLFSEAIAHPDVAALSIGTRPDCLPPDVLELLARLNRRKPVWVELGLQTIHEESAARIQRGYSLPVFENAVRELKICRIFPVLHEYLCACLLSGAAFFRGNRPPGRGCPVHRNPPGLPAAGCPGASRPLKPPKTGLGGTGTSDHP